MLPFVATLMDHEAIMYAKCNKSDRKEQKPYDFIHVE